MTPRGTPAFCALLAALGVACRMALSDHVFFALVQVPSHDMSQGLAFFTTSMHSIRLTGDIAWWFPGSFTGYAQYYQGLFSPLAPTYGHIVFIAWAHLVALLDTFGIRLPEYYQYLTVNYVVLPFMAFAMFAWFCCLVLRSRHAVALAVMAYVLSGIGLWQSAWMYYQEAFSVFFLLAASIAVLQRPSPQRALALLAAILVQLASLNYWTVYNIFFVAIVLGAYAATHRYQVARLSARFTWLRLRRSRRALAAAGAFVIVGLAWTAVIVTAMQDQGSRNVRRVYTEHEAVERVQETRRYTTELFNPVLERPLRHYPILNDIHNARYIGVLLLPLVAIAVFASLRRRTAWLLACAVLVLAICQASPWVVMAWGSIPFMDRIQHVFYFYSHYWQLLVVLLAAAGMDALLAPPAASARRTMLWLCGAGIAAAGLAIGWLALITQRFPAGDANLESNLRMALLLGIGSALLFRAAWSGHARDRRLAAAALLWLAFLDLSSYYANASRADMAVTLTRIWKGTVPSPEEQAALRRPWGPPQPEKGFAAGLDEYLPVSNEFWPFNKFMLPAGLNAQVAETYRVYTETAAPISFHAQAVALPGQNGMPDSVARDLATFDRQLHLDAAAVPMPARPADVPSPTGPFAVRWKQWGYNEFDIEVTAPADGWVMVRQLHDPQWRAFVDGAETKPFKANYTGMAVPVPRGTHRLHWSYEPPARRLYWFAAALLEAVLAIFLTLAFTGPGRGRNPISTARNA